MSDTLPDWSYPADRHPRRVSANGAIKWQDRPRYRSEARAGDDVAVARHDDQHWLVRFRSFDPARPLETVLTVSRV